MNLQLDTFGYALLEFVLYSAHFRRTIMSPMTHSSPFQWNWYYVSGGDKIGPVDEPALRHLLDTGVISRHTLVWRDGLPSWTPVGETDLLADPAALSLPVTSVNNTWVWILAFTPVLGVFLQALLAEAFQMPHTRFRMLLIMLSLAISYADERLLIKAGHDTEKFGGLAWLIPVYLYKRAESLQQSKSYFVVWVICFVLIFL